MTEITFSSKRVADTFRRRLSARGYKSALRSEQAGFVVRTEASRGMVWDIAGSTLVLREEQVRSVGGLGAGKSMTFGHMPSFAEFEKAFDERVGEHAYEMQLRGIDAVTMAAATPHHSGWVFFAPRALYDIVKKLASVWDSNIDAETAHWSEKEADEYQEILDAWERADTGNRYSVEELRENAGSLASSIMETLGFEWI